jgi:hypothetical protein
MTNPEFIKALDRFRASMLAKFEARDVKQGERSVTRVGNALLQEHGVYEDLWQHFYEEVAEFQLAERAEEKVGEAVDVANMAFLIWWRDGG